MASERASTTGISGKRNATKIRKEGRAALCHLPLKQNGSFARRRTPRFLINGRRPTAICCLQKNFSKDSIIFSTENTHVANRFTELLAEVWQVITEKKPQSLANGRVRTCLRLQYRIRTNASGFLLTSATVRESLACASTARTWMTRGVSARSCAAYSSAAVRLLIPKGLSPGIQHAL